VSPELLDELLDALLGEARVREAERLTFAFEAVDGGARTEPCVRCWHDEDLLHHRALEWPVFEALVRRAMLSAGCDPWQYRKPQAGTAAGRFQLAAAGETAQLRRLTLRPLARQGATSLVDDVLERLQQPGLETEDEPAAVEDAPVVRVVNLMLRNAHANGARRIVAAETGAQLFWSDDAPPERLAWPSELWPEVRRRLLYMAQLPHWERGPAISNFRVRIGADGDELSWLVEVPGDDAPLVLTLLAHEEPRAAPAEPQAAAAPLDPLLRAVLEEPHDLGRRRVFADQLLERGDPRGRFISLQLSGSSSDAPPPPDAPLWCGDLRSLWGEARFAWGFLDRLAAAGGAASVPSDDPHWSTVRALKLDALRPQLASRIIARAPLASLQALTLDAQVPSDAAVLSRLTSLCVTRLHAPTARWLDGLALPKLRSLELELGEDASQLARFLVLKAAWSVPDLVVDGRMSPVLWHHLPSVPQSVERVSLVFGPAERRAFQPAIVCTLRRRFSEAVLYGDVDTLYRGAPDVFAALQGLRSLEVVRLVSPRALDRGREGVLRKACAQRLPRAKLEPAAAGRPEVQLWWLAETPPRDPP